MPEATQLGKSHSWGGPGPKATPPAELVETGPAAWVQSCAFIATLQAHLRPLLPLGVHVPWRWLGNVVWVFLVPATAKEALPDNYLMYTHMGTAMSFQRQPSATVKGPGWGLTGLGATPALPLAQDPRTIMSRVRSTLGGVPSALRSAQPCHPMIIPILIPISWKGKLGRGSHPMLPSWRTAEPGPESRPSGSGTHTPDPTPPCTGGDVGKSQVCVSPFLRCCPHLRRSVGVQRTRHHGEDSGSRGSR